MRPALVITGMLGLSLICTQLGTTPGAHAASPGFLRYEQGYYLTNWSGHTWLCYGWQTGNYRCTIHWHRTTDGTPISDHAAWVPNGHNQSTTAVRHNTSRSGGSHSAPSGGGSSGGWQGSVLSLIRSAFGRDAGAALAVASCESGFNASAYNPSSGASGVFQFLASTWATTAYAGYSRFNAWANVMAAHQVFVRDGHSWQEWTCRP